MTDTLPDLYEIPFHTGQDTRAPFIWGQVAIWDVIRWLPAEQRHTLNMRAAVPVPGEWTMADLSRAVRALIERHDVPHSHYLAVGDELIQHVPGSGTLLPAAQQPSARAWCERSSVAARRATRALDYWRRNAWTLPPQMLATVADADWPPRTCWAALDSPPMAGSVRRLAERTTASPAVVVLAATTLLLAFHADIGCAAIRAIVSPRFRPENERLVAAFNQNALFRIDIADEMAGEFLHRATAAATMAYRHTEYDPRALESLVESVAAERGFAAGSYCFFNHRRFDDVRRSSPMEPEPLAEQPPAEDPASVTVLESDVVQYQSKFFLFVGGTKTRAVVRLSAHPDFLAPRSPVDFLADLDWLVGALADGERILDLRRLWQARHATPQ